MRQAGLDWQETLAVELVDVWLILALVSPPKPSKSETTTFISRRKKRT